MGLWAPSVDRGMPGRGLRIPATPGPGGCGGLSRAQSSNPGGRGNPPPGWSPCRTLPGSPAGAVLVEEGHDFRKDSNNPHLDELLVHAVDIDPACKDFCTTSEQFTADAHTPSRTADTCSPPGSSWSKANRAKASCTMLGDQLIHEAEVPGYVPEPGKQAHLGRSLQNRCGIDWPQSTRRYMW